MSTAAPRMTLEEVIRPRGVAPTGVTFVDLRGRRRALTYDELGRLAGAAGAALVAAGARPGDTVATVVENTLESVVGTLGAWMAGATLVSLPPVPRRARELYAAGFAPVLDALGCDLFVGSEPFADVFGERARVVRVDADPEPSLRDPEVPLAGVALVQFTSGSVGRPKGVALSAATVAGHVGALAEALAVDPARDRGVTWVPMYHDMGLVAAFLTMLARRVPVTVMPPAAFVLNPRSWLAECAAGRATMAIAADFAFRLATRAGAGEPAPDLRSLRYVFSGGERVEWETLKAFHAMAEPGGLAWEALTPMYGMAEATAVLTMPPAGRGPVRGPDGSVSVGLPLPGVELDAGERLRVRSPWLMDGYVTAEGVNPAARDGWFATGDSAYLHEGELYVRGRVDEVVVHAGRNYFAEDVEAVALGAVPAPTVGVSAFRVPDDPSRFALAVEVDQLERAAAPALARSLQGATAAALGIRVSPVLVLKPWTIPRTTSGKVRRPECRAMLAEDRWPAPRVLAVVH